MALALSEIRGAPVARSRVGASRLGLVKYGLATCLAALVVAGAAAIEAWKLLPLAVVAFYLVEAQAAFVFPAFVDGVPSPWGRSRELVRAAGGTVVVAAATLVIASVMLGGGLAGKGFLRSWCIGCLAVVLWYERLRT
jgi:hypothetical protein